jgi:hypothetical protein
VSFQLLTGRNQEITGLLKQVCFVVSILPRYVVVFRVQNSFFNVDTANPIHFQWIKHFLTFPFLIRVSFRNTYDPDDLDELTLSYHLRVARSFQNVSQNVSHGDLLKKFSISFTIYDLRRPTVRVKASR